MKITLFSDTHCKHDEITQDLPGGDLLLFGGDIMGSGYDQEELEAFCKWFDKLDNYKNKIFIGGNHDRILENKPGLSAGIWSSYNSINYLQDEEIIVDNTKVYGSPWQPWFYNWAFNLPRKGPGLMSKWEAIPDDTDILITHGPAFGILDTVEGRRHENLGCELLSERIKQIKPKIHLCGHIHSGYGYYFDGDTHFFNASVLNEQYNYTQKPFNVEWNKETNQVIIL